MPKKTAINKRKEALKKQLYGKEVTVTSPNTSDKTKSTYSFSSTTENSRVDNAKSDESLLKRDLLKILLLSAVAFGFQFLLFWALTNNLIKLPWFS